MGLRGSSLTLSGSLPSGGCGSSALPGRYHGPGCGNQPRNPPAQSSAHPCCGRRTRSHCSPSPRCTGTHAGTKTLVIPRFAQTVGGRWVPSTPTPGGSFCAWTRKKTQSPTSSQLPSPCLPAPQERTGPYLSGLVIGICVQEDG